MDFEVVTKKGEAERVKMDGIEKRKMELKRRRVAIKVTKRTEESPLINLYRKTLLGGEQRRKF